MYANGCMPLLVWVRTRVELGSCEHAAMGWNHEQYQPRVTKHFATILVKNIIL